MDRKLNGLGIYYDHTKMQDKHFFGGFLNLAQDNIESVIKAFCVKFNTNQKKISSGQFAEVCFIDKDSDTDFQNKIKFLKMHLPVIGYLQYSDGRKKFRENLELLLKAIDSLRNFYTHYYHKPIEFSTELYPLLDAVFANVSKDVRQFKKNDDKTRHLLSKNLSKEFQIRHQQQIEKLKELQAKGKKVNLNDTAGIRNGVFNTAFKHLIYKEGEDFKTTTSYSSFYHGTDSAENGISLSQSGLLFLLSMFLGRKETEDLKSRVRGFKARIIKEGEEQISGLKFMATHWVFSYLSFKGIKQRLSTDFDQETLLVQIIDELSKVPDEVFASFDSTTKERFIEDINEYIRTGNEDFSLQESIISHPVIRKRYESKFNYFAVRFLDEFVNFPSLRFQVHVGNFVHDRRIKNINGTGFQTERVVKDRIKAFGKLSEISNLKANYIKNQLNLPDENEWAIFPNPSYVFIDNNIPIHISPDKTFKNDIAESKKLRRIQQPEEMKIRIGDKKKKFDIAKSIANKDILNPEVPVALLSLNEIPALLYEVLVKKTTPTDIEKIIKDKLNNHLEKIKNYDPEKPLPASQISKRLRNNTTNKGQKTINTEKLIHLINREIEITETKLDIIAKNHNELKEKFRGKPLRKFLFTTTELGHEASWLAEDIKRFMPEAVRKNWKGYQHSQLQQSLAFFEKRPKEALNILQSGWDFTDGSSFWNGWIINSFTREKYFDTFYKYYLEGRKNYFSSLSENIKQHTLNNKNLRRFIDQQMPKSLFENRHYIMEDLETEKNKLLSKPLVFPRGIFDSKPTFIKGVKVNDEPHLFADWYRYGYDTKHTFQKFYEWERDYNDLLGNELLKDNDFSKNSIHYDKQSQLDLIQLKQDLKIKKIKIQDLFLKLIAENIFEKIFEYSPQLLLNELYLTQEERLEKEQAALQQSQRNEGDFSDNIMKDNFIWSKTVAYETSQIFEPKVKIKDIGKFKRFLRNEKVIALFSYDENKRWNKEGLENELFNGENSYEVIRREKLFKEIQNLEKKILDQWIPNKRSHPEELEHNGNPKFKTYIVNGILRKGTAIYNTDEDNWFEHLNENDFETLNIETLESKSDIIKHAFLLTLIRNKFAHNQLPAKEFFEFIKNNYPAIKGETASELYINFARFSIHELSTLLT